MKFAMLSMMLLAVGMAACASPGSSGITTGPGNGVVTGAAPERYMGERPNVNGTWNGSTSSSTMLMQRIKQDDARGATSGGADTKY